MPALEGVAEVVREREEERSDVRGRERELELDAEEPSVGLARIVCVVGICPN